MRLFEYVDTDGNRDSELLYLKFKRDSVGTARKSAGANSLDFAQELLVGQGCHCIDRHERLGPWPNEMFTLNQLTVCFVSFVSSMSLYLSVVSAEEHSSTPDAMAIE